MSKGYLLLVRQLLRHPRFKPRGSFTQFEAWYWLIEAAAFSVCEVPVMNGSPPGNNHTPARPTIALNKISGLRMEVES